MQMTKLKGPVGILLLILLLGSGHFAGDCGAESLSIREIAGNAAKYRGRQVQVDGRVERWVETGSGQKPAAYVLKDNFGDELQVKVSDGMPAVGEKVAVKGQFIVDSAGNDFYLQSQDSTTGVKPGREPGDAGGHAKQPIAISLATAVSRAPGNLLALGAVAAVVFLFIAVVALRVKRANKKIIDVPDFSFDETETIKIDVNGKFFGSQEDDECTVILMPGYFKITKGPQGLEGRLYRLTSALTKVGREESSVNKSTGWIAIPAGCTSVSRYQADLVYKGGAYYVENRSRSTETRVNGVPITSEEPYPLSDQDVIAFGEIELTYAARALG
jgi:hypothetical protein